MKGIKRRGGSDQFCNNNTCCSLPLPGEREREREEEESVKLSKLGIEKKTCYINLPWQKEG